MKNHDPVLGPFSNTNLYRPIRIWLREKRTRFLEIIGWVTVQVSVSDIAKAGGSPGSNSLLECFDNNDRGLQRMKDWCYSQCHSSWKYDRLKFIFKSEEDAALFKLFWIGGY